MDKKKIGTHLTNRQACSIMIISLDRVGQDYMNRLDKDDIILLFPECVNIYEGKQLTSIEIGAAVTNTFCYWN